MKHTTRADKRPFQMAKAKRWVCAVISVILACAVLIGCQESGEGNATDTDGQTQQTLREFSPKNVIMISVQDLGDGLVTSSYRGAKVMPSLNGLLSDFSYYSNNVSSSRYAAGLDVVMSSSVYAPMVDAPIVGLQGDKLTTLAKVLSEKGFYTLAAVTGPDSAYGGEDVYKQFGYQKLVTVNEDKLERTSIYDAALNALKNSDKDNFFLSITDLGLYTGDTDIRASEIGGDGDVAAYAKRMAYTDKMIGEFTDKLKSEGLYDDTVIIITGTGAPFLLDDQSAVEGMSELTGSYTLENCVKAPLLVKVPDRQAKASELLVSHTDVLLTVTEALGIDDNRLWLNGLPLDKGHDRIYIQSVLNRGSYIDAECIVSADESATPSLSSLYNRSSGEMKDASSKAEEMQSAVAYFEEHYNKLAYGLSVKCYEKGTQSACEEYEANKTTAEIPAEQSVGDMPPADKNAYKNEVDLLNRSVMVCANEFEGQFISVMFKDGGLTLTPGATEGTFISNELDLGGSFKQMLASWNATSDGGTVEVSVAVKLDNGEFTDWFSWGVWSAIRGVSGSASTENEHGAVGIDILTLNETCGGTVKFRVDIKQTEKKAPIVYNVTLACDKRASALKAPTDTYKKLDVPYRRQGDVAEIGGSICSATSLSMLLLYQGERRISVEDVAWGVRDYGAGKFGNWAFNVAYAGELGYNAYIDYFDVDAIKYAISTGHPVACSIRVKTGQLAGSGYPSYQTNGHLLCVVGYEVKNGQTWLYINDPARPEVKAFLASEFETIYRGVSYIVQARPDTSK